MAPNALAEVATEKQVAALAEIGIETLEQLAETSAKDVAEAKGIGPKTAAQLIERALEAQDLPDPDGTEDGTDKPAAEEGAQQAPDADDKGAGAEKPPTAEGAQKPPSAADDDEGDLDHEPLLSGLLVGRIVHFNDPRQGGVAPAIVQAVHDAELGAVRLVVFCHPSHSVRGDLPLRWVERSHFSAADDLPTGAWGWPPQD